MWAPSCWRWSTCTHTTSVREPVVQADGMPFDTMRFVTLAKLVWVQGFLQRLPLGLLHPCHCTHALPCLVCLSQCTAI